MKKGSKKGSYFFKVLTDQEKIEFKQAFQRNRITEIENYLDKYYLSFERFMIYAFVWFETKQGNDYWQEISLREIQEPQDQTS